MKPSPNWASPSFSVILTATFWSSAISASVRRALPSHCFGRSLQRRHRVVRPHTLKVRMPVGRFVRAPIFEPAA